MENNGGSDIEVEVAVLRERVAAMNKTICMLEEMNEKNIKLAADELARRLENLNGEAERLRKMQATYLPRETYEQHIDGVEKRITSLERYTSNLDGRMWVGGGIVLVLAGIVSVVVREILK